MWETSLGMNVAELLILANKTLEFMKIAMFFIGACILYQTMNLIYRETSFIYSNKGQLTFAGYPTNSKISCFGRRKHYYE